MNTYRDHLEQQDVDDVWPNKSGPSQMAAYQVIPLLYVVAIRCRSTRHQSCGIRVAGAAGWEPAVSLPPLGYRQLGPGPVGCGFLQPGVWRWVGRDMSKCRPRAFSLVSLWNRQTSHTATHTRGCIGKGCGSPGPRERHRPGWEGGGLRYGCLHSGIHSPGRHQATYACVADGKAQRNEIMGN